MSLNHVKLVGTATVGPKGQVVIPAEIREKMKVLSGDKLIALYIEDKCAIGFVTEEQAESIISQLGNHINALQKIIK